MAKETLPDNRVYSLLKKGRLNSYCKEELKPVLKEILYDINRLYSLFCYTFLGNICFTRLTRAKECAEEENVRARQ